MPNNRNANLACQAMVCVKYICQAHGKASAPSEPLNHYRSHRGKTTQPDELGQMLGQGHCTQTTRWFICMMVRLGWSLADIGLLLDRDKEQVKDIYMACDALMKHDRYQRYERLAYNSVNNLRLLPSQKQGGYA